MTITSSPLLSPDDVARHTFATVRRGFDPKEVRAYLESLAHGIGNLAAREQDLLEDLADAERRAANPVLDEPTLVAALGQQTARVLQSAHEVAEELTTKARQEADRLLADASERADAVRTGSETEAGQRMAAAEADAARVVEEASRRAAALIESAERDSEAMRSRTKDECRAIVEEAQQLRARVLADLSRRRRQLHGQIEQLRAGRERLTETIEGVRRSVDGIADDLSAAEDHAREAAESAGRAAAERPEDESTDELAAILQAKVAAIDVEPAGTGSSAEQAARVAAAATRSGTADAAASAIGAPGPGGAPPASGDVDELFARLRAGNEVAPDEVDRPAEADGDVDGEGPDSEAAGAGPVSAGVDGAGAAAEGGAAGAGDGGPAESAQPTQTVSGEPVEAAGAHEADEEAEPGATVERPPAAAERDELIGPVVTTLSRRLKRTLQDAQNDMLDHLRSNGSRWSPDVLPQETEQIDGLTTAVLPALEEAAEAGVAFAGGGGRRAPVADALVAIAHELAEEVVEPLRRRLSDDSGVADAGEAAAVEHVGAAFRDWRGPRVDRLAGDYVVAAFSVGSMTAVGHDRGGRLEWISVPGSGSAPCPDCEDNGLAGPQAPGEEFPTGHRHPPAHSGCRCLIAPAAP